jgi:hypothetical protein
MGGWVMIGILEEMRIKTVSQHGEVVLKDKKRIPGPWFAVCNSNILSSHKKAPLL